MDLELRIMALSLSFAYMGAALEKGLAPGPVVVAHASSIMPHCTSPHASAHFFVQRGHNHVYITMDMITFHFLCGICFGEEWLSLESLLEDY